MESGGIAYLSRGPDYYMKCKYFNFMYLSEFVEQSLYL